MSEPNPNRKASFLRHLANISTMTWTLLGGIALAVVLWSIRGTSEEEKRKAMKPGAVVDAPVTLVTIDKIGLACAAEEGIKDTQCAYSNPGKPTKPKPRPEKTLAPYVTTDRQLFLIAGLFEQPAVDERYRQEPPGDKASKDLKRFVANCKVRLLGQMEARTRWDRGGKWGEPSLVWAAVPVTCTVD